MDYTIVLMVSRGDGAARGLKGRVLVLFSYVAGVRGTLRSLRFSYQFQRFLTKRHLSCRGCNFVIFQCVECLTGIDLSRYKSIATQPVPVLVLLPR